MEEEEARFRPGSVKHTIFTVLKETGPGGMTANEIISRTNELGLRDWSNITSSKNTVVHACIDDSAFTRVAPGANLPLNP